MEYLKSMYTKEQVVTLLKAICELDFIQEDDEVYNHLNDALTELEGE